MARSRARGPAEEKLRYAIDDAQTQLEAYAKQLRRAEVLKGVEKPKPLDFEALAKANHLTYGQTPLLDVLDVSQIIRMDPTDEDPAYDEFLRAQERSVSRDGRGLTRRTIIDLGYTGDIELMLPRQMVDGMNMPEAFPTPPDNLFVFWRREVEPERVPTLDEVRDQVIKAWKMKEALPLAQDKAAEMAKQVREAAKPLAEVFPDSAKSVIHTTQFSWMTRGSLPSGSAPIRC